MPEFIIRYKDFAGVITNRRISNIEQLEVGYFSAFCHERGGKRTFKSSRILSVLDPETGESLDKNKLDWLGAAPSLAIAQLSSTEQTTGDLDLLKRRSADKRALFKEFKLPILENLAKQRFYKLFGDACFKCGSNKHLVMDHHIPIALGGRLVPGNIVALCHVCNGLKSDRPPTDFYSGSELKRLEPYLKEQLAIFNFSFDWAAWDSDRAKYLTSLGIPPKLVNEALSDPDHPFHIPP